MPSALAMSQNALARQAQPQICSVTGSSARQAGVLFGGLGVALVVSARGEFNSDADLVAKFS